VLTALIIGAGAQGRVVLDILRAEGRYESIQFVDDNPAMRGREVNGAKVAFGVEEALRPKANVEMIVALGNPDTRRALAACITKRGIPLLNAIHPSAVIMPSTTLGKGIMVGPAAVVNSNAQIGDNVIINTGAVVEHDCVIAEGSAVGPGARLGGRVTLGSCAFIATGAIVTSRVFIGARSVVGAGAVVHRDLPESVLAFGVPARVQRNLDSTFDWSQVL
jgi:sugar O-acyltransferase (sialic acid O-acetyltransferase NeuD family)